MHPMMCFDKRKLKFMTSLTVLCLLHYAQANIFSSYNDINTLLENDIANILHPSKSIQAEDKSNIIGNHQKKEQRNKDNSAHGFDEHQIVVPIRLHHLTGHPVSHGCHFRKRSIEKDVHVKKRRRRDLGTETDKLHFLRDLHILKRTNFSNDVKAGTYYDVIPNQYSSDSLDVIEEDKEDYLDHRVANYSIEAFGEKFLFHLTPYEDFLAPNYTLHFMGDPNHDKGIHPDVPRHCYYSGYVNGRREHRAILSVCRGLFGAFRTHDSDYLIQPDTTGSNPSHDETDEEGTKPHRIFKRSTRAAGGKGKQLCGYTEPNTRPLDRRRQDSSTKFNDDAIHNLRNLAKSRDPSKKFLFHNRRKFHAHSRLRRRKISLLRRRLHLLSAHAQKNSTQMRRILKTIFTLSSSYKKSPFRFSSSSPYTTNRKQKVLSRKKRYLSYPRNVEVMVTADNEMLKTHDDVEHYVLTLMAIVNHVYHDPSIENQINIVVVKLVVVGDSQVRNGPHVVTDAHTCLRNFCDWQFRQNVPDDSHPNHHDTAVLITGRDICRSQVACDTLGLAELGTMCDLRRSCSINEDNGLSTAFTIAHEIGHEFNAPHDNNEKCLDARGRTVELNVMSPTLDNNAHPWAWSKCSAKYITGFLDNGNGQCLLDEPPQRVLSLPIEEPGEVFNANDQCSFVYGKGVNHCNFMFQKTCARLWCISQNISHGCRTPHVPWADGTRCGDRMWCQRGQCVPEDRHKIPVDGNWGEWSKFGDCSRTCGGGIKSAIRECNNPKPQYGGLYCTGKRKKFRPCNYQECPSGGDFRAEQCAAYNNWSSHHRHPIRGITSDTKWIPKTSGILLQDRCKLICQVKSDDLYASPWYVLKPKVINGTPCGPDTHDICVEGICKRAGCDHVLNSRTTEDSCGICNGDNTGCRRVQGSYNSGYKIGYNRVVVIPAGANNIVITQRSYTGDPEDNNYLALRDTRGSYILNGNRSVMKNKHRMHGRSRKRSRNHQYFCDYSGTDNVIETINCTKAIHIDIVVEVLSAGDLMPPNINYRYNVPVKDRTTYRWDPNGSWSSCSKTCDGKMKRKIYCVRSDQQIVPDRRCNHLAKPNTIIKPCNTECTMTWHSKPSECSVRCGSGFVNLEFECRKITLSFNEDGSTSDRMVEVVSDSLCPQPKPDSVAPCQGECLPTSWEYEEWSECSRSCGGGIQTRRAMCRDSKGQQLDASECESRERVVSRTCANVPCPQWVASSFSKCMVTCGVGVRQRRIWCSARGTIRSDSECDMRTKPASTMVCTTHACPNWKYDNWGPCSVTCGEGTSVRLYHCVDHQDRPVDDVLCDTAMLRPDTRACSVSRDCYVRSSGVFGDSPSVIWRGLGRRGYSPTTTTASTTTTTTTIRMTTTTRSSPSLKSRYRAGYVSDQAGVFLVNSRREMARWRTGSWTECSASCGQGSRRRYVSCRNRFDQEVNERDCGSGSRPLSYETCEISPCKGIWRSGKWSSCSSTCGEGIRSRYVGCLYSGRYYDHDVYCVGEERPVGREACNAPVSCTTTATTTTTIATTAPTTTITTTTASTTSTTTTTTPATTTTTLATTATVSVAKNRWLFDDVIRSRSFVPLAPQDSEIDLHDNSANPKIYQEWRTGPWSECSSTCGGGTQQRAVVCWSRSGTAIDVECDPAEQPLNIQVCRAEFCPKWRRGKWEKCSRSCGRGKKSRRVYCVMSDGTPTYDHRCDVLLRPVDVDVCSKRSCPGEHRWRKSAWSACSATCGRGTKTRQVSCVDNSGRIVADQQCANVRRSKPREVRRCVKQRRCPKWRTGKWNQCSATCGVGIQRRRVNCRYKRKIILVHLCDVNRQPDDTKQCNVTECTTYRWHTGSWSGCSASCGEGVRYRSVTCRSDSDHRVVDSSVCESELSARMPPSRQTCNSGPCRASWNVGSWSECSLTCGPGIQRREVKCSYIDPMTYKESDVNSCDLTRKPTNVRDCNWGRCNSRVYWRVGSWSQCSSSCGDGTSVRRVVCTDHATQSALHDDVCERIPSMKPERNRKCRIALCVPRSCRQLKKQQRIMEDGEYFLKVNGSMIKIYCFGMNTTHPLEYVSLTNIEENYSEIFGYRLINADRCPGNGSRDSNCACHRDHPDEGFTMFQKVRLDVTTMRVQPHDFTFATTRFGNPVPFGVAGDCYSRNNCPQGVFRINFKGTGLVVSSSTRWRSYGLHSVRRTHRSHSGDLVAGTCGGYCSRCQPDPVTGLRLRAAVRS